MTSRKPEIIAEPGELSFTTRQVLDAPRALVFDAWTKAGHLKRCMGPREVEIASHEVDLRMGGGFRFDHRAPDGQEFAYHGVYLEIVRPGRLVGTFVFEAVPDHEALETVPFGESDGKTTVATTTVHQTVEGRDGHLAGGMMEAGMAEGYKRFDALLADAQEG